METFSSAIIGFLTGVLATWFFWRTLLWQRPIIKISDKVFVETNSNTGKREIRFKVYNAGKNQVTNIKVNAWLCDLHDAPGGFASRGVYKLPLESSETLTLCPIGKEDRPWGLTPEKIFLSAPDIDFLEFLNMPNTRIMFTLQVSDAISGTTVVEQVTYAKRDIAFGTFAIGTSFEAFPN